MKNAAALALIGLAACGALGSSEAPWNTSPTPDSHSQSFFPIGKGAAHDVTGGQMSCDGCHSPQAATFKQFDCTGCHTDATTTPLHSGVTGYQWTSDACYGCHRDGSAGLPANHDASLFPVTGTKHANIACSQCHGATKNVGDLRCAPCHAQADMASKHGAIPATTTGTRSGVTVTNYQWASLYCVQCHADGQVNRIASHPSVRNGISGNGHQPFCLVCHGTLRGDKTWAADFGTYSCLACHTDNNGGGGGG